MSRVEELLSSEESGRRGVSAWWKVGIAGAVILLLALAIFLPPLIHLGKYRRSITASMSEALGRPVYVGGMQLRLLPMPGIVMSDFTVEEDPAFGAEPALHANSVVASLRMMSLWRGRLEVSRIRLDDANLILARNKAGQWSVGSVLLRAAQIPNAPTGQRHAGARPRFPYIEATNARIDFKNGVEKRPFSLMNAEFSMWQAEPNEWRLRLKAQPVRTDRELHLSDTGELQVEGSLRRAANLDAMPVRLQAEWSGAQLGQVSRLLAGFDSGWRGDLDVTATIGGTVGDLQLQTQLQAGNLRRQEFAPGRPLEVDATCRGEYRHPSRTVSNITCFWPQGSGHLLLTGNVHTFAPAEAHLQIEVNQIPAAFPLEVLALMRPHAQNVTATGALNGSFAVDLGETPSIAGEARATGVVLRYPGGTLALPTLNFVAAEPLPPKPPHKGKKAAVKVPAPARDAIVLEPAAVAMGGPEPVKVDGQADRAGFRLHVSGPASVARLMAVGSNFGLLENAMALAVPKGHAQLDTTTAGNWLPPLMGGSTGIATTGTLHVEGVELRAGFLRAPVQVVSADVNFAPDEVDWEKAALRYAGMDLQGSAQFPAACNQGVACPATVSLTADSLQAAAIETDLAGQPSGLLGMLTNALGEGSGAGWPPLRGTLGVSTLELGKLAVQGVTASVAVEGKKLSIDTLDGTALGGKLHASGTMDASSGTPQWILDVRLSGATAEAAGAVFRENWGAGKGSAEAKLTMSGYRGAELASSASGTFQFTWQNGGLPEMSRVSQPALEHFDRWTGKGTIGNGTLTVIDGGVLRGGRTSAVQGKIGFSRSLNLTMETRRGKVRIGGSLEHPTVR